MLHQPHSDVCVFVWLWIFSLFSFSLLSIRTPQAAFKYAAQKSQVAATDIVFSTRHNNRADKMQPHRFILALGWTTRATT